MTVKLQTPTIKDFSIYPIKSMSIDTNFATNDYNVMLKTQQSFIAKLYKSHMLDNGINCDALSCDGEYFIVIRNCIANKYNISVINDNN